MPDLFDDLRRYGDAVESVALTRRPDDYVDSPKSEGIESSRRRLIVLAAAALVVVGGVLTSISLATPDGTESVRVVTPPTTAGPAPEWPSPTSMPTVPLAPTTPAIQLPASGATWKPLDPGPLSLRGSSAVVWTGTQMIVWGGAGSAPAEPLPELDDGASYVPERGTWTPLAPAPISARALTVSAWTGSEIIIWGGGGGHTGWASRTDGAAYDPVTDSWRTIAPSPLPPGPLYAGAWTGAELVVVGADADGLRTAAYRPGTDSWRSLPDVQVNAMPPGTALEVSWSGSRIVVMAAHPLVGPTQAVVLDPTNDQWSISLPQGFSSRSIDTAVVDGRLYIASYMQRSDGTTSFDAVTGNWTQPVSLSEELSCEGGSTLLALDQALFASGCGHAGVYDPAASTWRPVAAAPTPGDPSALAWTGKQVLLWGPDGLTGGSAGPMGLWSLQP